MARKNPDSWAAVIEKTYMVSTEAGGRTFTHVDGNGVKWKASADIAVGLSRVVRAQNAAGRLLRERVYSPGYFGARSHDSLNRGMERAAGWMRRSLGDSDTEIRSDFASLAALQAAGSRTVAEARLPVDLVPLYFTAARKLREASVGQPDSKRNDYHVRIDTDLTALPEDQVNLFGVGNGNPRTGLWQDFHDAVGEGREAFSHAYERGIPLQGAYQAATLAITNTVERLQLAI